MGSVPYADTGGTGVTFRVWAPNASSVGVKGRFSSWSTIALTKDSSGGTWSADIANAVVGDEYKYVINGNSDHRDPRSRRVVNSAGNSVVYKTNSFDWGGDTASPPWKNDLVIYEMHVGTFNAESWIPSSFDKVIEKLDHIERLGVSAIEIMPVNEFAGDRSWGYNPADVFAIESALGGPDAFKRFVKACHQRGIAVLVDVVHNHYGPSDLPTWQFDGWSQNGKGGIYFYNDERSSTMWGETRPDYGRTEVRDFIKDQIRMFLDEYHVDGFRWDSVFNIIYYNSGSGSLPDGVSMLNEINSEINTTHPGTIRIAEDHAFDSSMNFDAVWEVSFRDHLQWQVTRGSDADRNMYWLADKITAWPSLQRVLYSESHDTTGDLNNKKRLPREIDSSNPWSIWARKRQLLAESIVMTSPGIPMIFQGQEMNEDWSFSSSQSVRWSLTNTWSGIVQAYSDLVRLRRNIRGGTQGLKGTGVTAHHIDNQNKVLAFTRWDQGGQVDDVVVVANFSVKAWTNNDYEIQFPTAGTWYTWFNGDSTNYSADFGGVGSAYVVASGSPAKAAVKMGSYSALIFSKTPPPLAGSASLSPNAPTGCVPVSVSYSPLSGPLSSAASINLSIGANGWQNTTNVPMTNNGAGGWSADYTIPYNTLTLDFAFNNGATNNTVWDNNLGGDWHVSVTGCANLPSTAFLQPAVPVGCVPVTLRYEENSGPLAVATGVFAYVGRNNWQDIVTVPMTNSGSGTWWGQYAIPAETWQLDYVFNDNAATNRIWDNNNGANWHAVVASCLSTEINGLEITNPASDQAVAEDVTNVSLSGRASSDMAGYFRWTNKLNGASGVLAAGTNWNLSGIPLAEGANLIQLYGTNSGVNPNAGASDDASNSVYRLANAWQTGQEGGVLWGGAWQLTAGASSGHFLAQTGGVPNLDIGDFAWALWANGGGIADAVRPLAAPLHVGDTLSLALENNFIDGGSVGFGLQNKFGQNVFEFIFIGGGTNYLINDAINGRPTGIPWTGTGLQIAFQLLGVDTYALTVHTQTFFGTLAATSESAIRKLRIWNYNAGGGADHNVYVDQLRIAGAPLDTTTYEDELTVTRPFGALSDQDGDGYLRWEEEFTGTDPANASSHLPNLTNAPPNSLLSVHFDNTTPGRWYDLFFRTSLINGSWARCGLDALGWGGPLTLVVTNSRDTAFYRCGIYSP